MYNTLPLVSIIIRTKNRAGLFAYAVNSVMAQKYRPIELVVVNDGGEDVGGVLTGLDDEWLSVRYIRNIESRGRSRAANQGLDSAAGEYLMFLDDDDWLDPHHLPLLVETLHNNPDAAVAYAGVRFCASPDGETKHLFNSAFDPVRLMRENYLPIHAVLFHRSLVVDKGCRLDTSLAVFEDWDLWLQMARHSRFVHHKAVTAGYRSGGTSGAGWGHDATEVESARIRLLEKWKRLWSGRELDCALRWNSRESTQALKQCRVENDRLLQTYRELASQNGELAKRHEALARQHEALASRYEALASQHEGLIHDHRLLGQSRDELARSYRQLSEDHSAVLSSLSWAVTGPLRSVGEILGVFGFVRRFEHYLRSKIPGPTTNATTEDTDDSSSDGADPVLPTDLSPPAPQAISPPGHTALRVGGDIPSPAVFTPTPARMASIGEPRIGVMAHVYYPDLFPEICRYLNNIPIPFELLISVTNEADRASVVHDLERLNSLSHSRIKVVPNRGRNIAPLLVAFREEVRQLDILCHIHTKKSLYSGAECAGWRRYLYREMLGSPGRVRAILAQFVHDADLGILYPETYGEAPYWGHTWLSNRVLGGELLHRMGIDDVDFSQYIDYPLGAMFWARTDALEPLLDMAFDYDAFPEEQGQTDGALQHAIERCFVFSSLAAGLAQRIIQSTDHRQAPEHEKNGPTLSASAHSGGRDTLPGPEQHHFLSRNHKNLHQYLAATIPQRVAQAARNASVLSFDLFDTLLIRPFTDPDSLLRKLEEDFLKVFSLDHFFDRRKAAEGRARLAKRDGDVSIDEIYAEMARYEGLPFDTTERMKELEIETEYRFLAPRPAVVETARAMKGRGLRTIAVSDMYLEPGRLEDLLRKKGIDCIDALYVSNALGARKDDGRIWPIVLEREGIDRRRLCHVGDNEQSDIQYLVDNGFLPPVHVMRPSALSGQLRGAEHLYRLFRRHHTWRNDLISGLIANRLMRQVDAGDRDIHSAFAQPRLLGFSVFGPIIFCFLAKLVCRAWTDGIQELRFLSREGWLLDKAYSAMERHPALAHLRHRLPRGGYLLCSRTFAGLAAIGERGEGLELQLKAHFDGTLRHLLIHRFGLEEAQLTRYLDDADLELAVSLPRDIQEILGQLHKCLPLIGRKAAENRALFHSYWGETVQEPDQDKVGIVDVGYSGTIQKALMRVFDRPLSGYYFVTHEAAREILQADGSCWACFGQFVSPPGDPPLHQYSLLLEAVMTAPHGQLNGFRRGSAGIEPLYKEPGDAQHHFSVIDDIHRGAIEFVDDMVDLLGEDLFSVDWDGDTVQTLVELVANRSLDIGNLSELLTVEDDFCGKGTLRVLDYIEEQKQLAAQCHQGPVN